MNKRSDQQIDPQALRDKVIGLGEQSIRKSYYPLLLQQIAELEATKDTLEDNTRELSLALRALQEEQTRAKQNEHKFQTLFEQISDGVLLADLETRKLFLGNTAILSMLGYSEEELYQLHVSDIYQEEDSSTDDIFLHLSQFSRNQEILDVPIRRKDGSILYADIHITLIELDGIQYALGMVRDITEKKEAEMALEASYMETVLALALAVESRDTYTGGHSQNLASWAENIAVRVGCDQTEIQTIRWAALLHDIGKIGVPDEILRKPGPLSPEEWAIMKRHPEIGASILGPIKRLRGVSKIVRAHHERWDGTGYPDGLRQEEIPLGARILTVVDSFGAMIDNRVYRKARTIPEAMQELFTCAGSQFDQDIVAIMASILPR